MKVVKEIILDEEVVKQLQKLHYEYFSLKDTFVFMLDQHSNEENFFETNAFKKFEERLVKTFTEYEKYKNEITNNYIPEEYLTEKYAWEMDFDNNKLLIFEV